VTGGAPTPLQVHLSAGPGAPADLLRRAVVRTLRREGVESAELSVSLLDDDAMAVLNRRWLGRPGSTDVLAFSLAGEGEPPLGDVYVGWERAARQAVEHGVPVAEELVRLVVHGTLHVLGHDHPEGPERLESDMFRLQEALVRELVSSGSGPGGNPDVEPAGDGGAGAPGRGGAA